MLAISVLEHLPDPERAIEGMIDALRTGGRLLIVSPQYGGLAGGERCERGNRQTPDPSPEEDQGCRRTAVDVR